ncbi:hypothetical protein [Streptomyces sp. x-80]|uniref:hypothetical protein n=1 Tax=Streptomyces sp. x-80 TaxID=2789282 RepID=UPI00397EB114
MPPHTRPERRPASVPHDDFTKKRSSAKGWGIAAGAVAVFTALGIAVSLSTGGETGPAPVSAPSAGQKPKKDVAAAQVLDGVPIGYPRTAAGAKAAAANFATVRGSTGFLTDASSRRRALAVMNAQTADRSATAEADKAAGRAATELRGDAKKLDPQQAISRTGVLSSRVLAFDIHKSAIRLWTTTVRGSAAGHAPPKGGFQSVTVNLLWEKGDWKVASLSSGSGLVAPLSTQQATNAASDFSEYAPGQAADPVLRGTDEGGLPGPYARGSGGARAAAANAVVLYGDPRFFTDAAWRHRMLVVTTAPSVRAAVIEDADSTAQLVADNRQLGDDGKTADGGQLVTRTAVLATRSLSGSDQAASVELWTVSVGGIAGAEESERPRVAFQRMNVDLVWVDGTWKTTAVTQGEPLVPSPPAAEQAAPASRFADVGGVADASALA